MKRQLYFMVAAVICIGIISTVFIIRSKKEEAKEAAIKIEQQNKEKDDEEKKEEKIETFEGRLARVKEEASKKGYPKGVIAVSYTHLAAEGSAFLRRYCIEYFIR